MTIFDVLTMIGGLCLFLFGMNIMGDGLDMSFLDFIWYNGKPGMFFMVELGACLSACIVSHSHLTYRFAVIF